MSFSVSRASTTKHSHAGELLAVHPRGKSIKSRITSVIRRRTASGAAEEDTGATHINTLLDDVQEFEQELERFYWHTKELKAKLADAFNASYNMVTDAMHLWKDGKADTQDLQECQRVLGEVNETYRRRFMAEIDRELLAPIGADMTMFKPIKEKATKREQYLRDVKYYRSKMETLDPSRDPDRYSRNEEKLFNVQHAVVEETKSLIHDMKGIERAKQTMLDRYVPKAVALQRELWTTIMQQGQRLDALASIARNRGTQSSWSSDSPNSSTLEPLPEPHSPAAPSAATAALGIAPASTEDEAVASHSEEATATSPANKLAEEEHVPFSKKMLSPPEPIEGLDLEFEVTLNSERAPGLVLHRRLVTTSSDLNDIEYAAVNLVLPGSIADMLGIRKGDIVTRVNGHPVVNAAFDSVKEEIRNYIKPMTVQFARVSQPDLLAHPPSHWKVLAQLTEAHDEPEGLPDATSEYEDDIAPPAELELSKEDSDALSSSLAGLADLQVASPQSPTSPARSRTPANTPRADMSAKRLATPLHLQGIPEDQQADQELRRLALPVVRDISEHDACEEVPPHEDSDDGSVDPRLSSSPISNIRTQLAKTFEQQPGLEAGLLPRIAPLPQAAAPPETELQVAAPTPFSTPLQRTSKTAGAVQRRAMTYSSSSFDGSSGASTPFADDDLHVISAVEEADEQDNDRACEEVQQGESPPSSTSPQETDDAAGTA